MNQTAVDVLSTVTHTPTVAQADLAGGVNTVGAFVWSGAPFVFAVMLGALALLVWFIAHGESWDQRRPRLWQRQPPQGMGRRDSDYLEASDKGPFRQKPARR